MKTSLLACAFALALVAIAWIGRIAEGQNALAAADVALERGDPFDAIVSARAAAEARCPGCAAPAAGFGKLVAIARSAEGRADVETAFTAWRAVRAASLSTAVFRANSAERDLAEAELARLGHRVDREAAEAGGIATAAASEERLRAALRETETPSGAAYALAAAGFGLFLFGALRFARGTGLGGMDLAMVGSGATLAGVGALLF